MSTFFSSGSSPNSPLSGCFGMSGSLSQALGNSGGALQNPFGGDDPAGSLFGFDANLGYAGNFSTAPLEESGIGNSGVKGGGGSMCMTVAQSNGAFNTTTAPPVPKLLGVPPSPPGGGSPGTTTSNTPPTCVPCADSGAGAGPAPNIG